ncbi:MAG: sigma-70 family RNA polymerase sigma factor [Myxococcales bacterium]|nr:sigma-70 family RNA polymerase sigma factor [Myxococcales bacterium]
MAAYVAGDEAAYRILFDRYAPLLFRIVRRRVASEDEAHDVVQQAFLNMHRFRADFRTDARLRPWLTTIAMNLVREHHRRLGRRKERSLEATEGRVQAIDPATPVEDYQQADSVRKAMRSLLDNQREVIELRWFEEKSYDEISEIVGASVAAVRVRAHRGYERLRGALAEAC